MRGIIKCLMGSMLATAMALPFGGFALLNSYIRAWM